MTAAATFMTTAAGYWHHGDIGNGWWFLMMIGMLAFWVLVIAGIVWLTRNTAVGGGLKRASAREVLDERLARGEIEIDEYERRLAALTRNDSGAVPPAGAGLSPPPTVA